MVMCSLKGEGVSPWLVWLSGLNTGLKTKRLLVQFPVRTHTCLGSKPGQQMGAHQRQPTDVSLTHLCFSPSLSPFLSL